MFCLWGTCSSRDSSGSYSKFWGWEWAGQGIPGVRDTQASHTRNCIKKSYKELLSSLGLFSLDGDLIGFCSFLTMRSRGVGWSLLSDRTQENTGSYGREGSAWVSGNGSSPGGWLGTGTGSQGNWSQHQVWQNTKSIWTTLSGAILGMGLCRARS